MFINNINPVLLSIGQLEIRYYGLVYAIGFLITYFILQKAVKTKKIRITEDQLDVYFIWLILGSILTARLFEVFVYDVSYYMHNLSEMYKIWNGGLSYQGGIVGAVLVTIFFAKKYKIKFYDIADIIVIPSMLMLAIGKLANYSNSELYGKVTDVPWCVVFQKIDTYCRHPVQIYEFLLYLAIFVGLLIYSRFKYSRSKSYLHSKNANGGVFWLFIMSYSVARFLISFLRQETLYLGLNMGQWLSIIIVILSFLILWRAKTKNI